MNSSSILVSVLIGSVGLGYIIYGRKQMHATALICGLALCIFPYFIQNIWLTLLIAAGIMLLPKYIDF